VAYDQPWCASGQPDRRTADGRVAVVTERRPSLLGRTLRDESARPLRVSPLTAQLLTVGVDIGGTKVAAGVVTHEGEVLDQVRRETPDRSKSPRVVEDTIVGAVLDLAERHEIHAVGIGAAGFIDAERANVLFSPHLSWRNEPLREAISSRLRLPVVVENDANAAVWAEWRFGAGRGESHLVCVNLGTGIGGAMIVNGTLQRGRFGVAGEFGHMQVVPDGRRCECGNRGCWEQYASGNVLVREAREMAAANSPVAHPILERAGGDVSAITGPLITAAAQDGDPAARELFEEIGQWLGVGMANLAAAFDPGTFVIGGGLSEAGDLLIGPARDSFSRSLTGRRFRPEARVVQAQLGNTAGLVGAADLARPFARRFRRARARARDRRARHPGAL
jgi:glucokinase